MTAFQKVSQAKSTLKTMFAVAATVITLSVSIPHAFAQTSAVATAQQSVAQVQDEVRGVLTQYGRFVQHQKYGEVWVPTVTPQGWHPYPPCNWVNTKKYGWYYDDKTAWGAIVHHYGRWVHDAGMGWIWTPGSEFSPGWVVWRTSPEWVGWAPMLPDEDVQTISTDEFNNKGYWIFVDAKKFAQGCNGTVAPAAQIPMLLTQTSYVTDIQLVGGITIFILPQYVVGPLIDIDVVFGPWPSWFLAQTMIDWNFVWNNLVTVNSVVYQNCPPQKAQDPVNPKPFPVNNPPRPPAPPMQPPAPPPVRPVDDRPPMVVTPICPTGTVFNDGACRLSDPCRGGTVRVGNACVPPVRIDPRPPVRVNDPCANLSGGDFQRCIRGTPPQKDVDSRPPAKRPPVTGKGNDKGNDDLRPVANQPPSVVRPSGPVGNTFGGTRPNGNNPVEGFNPNRPRPDFRLTDRPSNKLPVTNAVPMRPNPNPVVFRAGGGGVSQSSVGSNQQASNNNARRRLPMVMPRS